MTRICLAGAGALGSWIALFLAQPNIEFLIIDDDRVDDVNVPVSAFNQKHIGKPKAVALAELVWLKAGCEAQTYMKTLSVPCRPISVFSPDLVIDAFDNVESRGLLVLLPTPTLHVGVSDDGVGIAIWDENYTLPPGPPRGEDTFCTHQAGRKVLRMTAVVAAGVIETWMETGERESVVVTEKGVIV